MSRSVFGPSRLVAWVYAAAALSGCGAAVVPSADGGRADAPATPDDTAESAGSRDAGPDAEASAPTGAGTIPCGVAVCAAGSQVCCGGVGCVAPGDCNDAGYYAACTRAADCSAGAPYCCFEATSGSDPAASRARVTCAATCPGVISSGAAGSTVMTRACQTDADCAGYSGTVAGHTSAWTSCCARDAGSPRFCADPGGAAFGGYTCP